MVTPHNPHKQKSSLLDNHHRLSMVRVALEDYPKLKASTVEFDLPQPNYTVNTLAVLEEKHPEHQFCLIMGEDNLRNFHRWKNYEVILDRHFIYVYPRIGSGAVSHQFNNHPKIKKVDAPIMELSSTFIRKGISDGKNVRPMLPQSVWEYLDEMNFYRG